jgi:hypothetical protein
MDSGSGGVPQKVREICEGLPASVISDICANCAIGCAKK